MSIEISTKNKSLDLNDDAKVTIKKISSLFTILKTEKKQSYSYPFSLPISARNNTILSNNLLVQKENSISVTTKKNGVRLFKADMRIIKPTNENYEVALQLNQKVDFFNRKMNTLFDELGAFHITDNTPYIEFIAYPYSEVPGGFPNPSSIPQEFVVSGIKYYFVIANPASYATQVADIINADTLNNNALVTVISPNKIKIESVNSALPFYAYNIERESLYNIFWFPLPIDRSANRTIAVTHSNTIDALVDFRDVEYCFPFFTTIMEGQPTNFIYVNNFDGVSYTEYEYNITLPSLRIQSILKKVLEVEGWTLDSTIFENIEFEKLFLLNCYGTAIEGASNWDTIQNIQFFYADCLPNLSLAEFVEQLKILFCLNVNWDHTRKTLKLETANYFLSNKLAKEYVCTESFSEKVKDNKEGYTLKYNTPDYKEYIETYMLKEKVVENGAKSIVSDYPFLATNNLFGQKVKIYDGGLSINSSFSTFSKNSLKFLSESMWLKEGECKSINFMDYTTRQANYFTENYSLTWERLYQDFYKNYLSLLDNSEVEREVIFTFSELQSLDFLQRIRLEYSNYYIKELECTLINIEQLRILGKVKLIKTI